MVGQQILHYKILEELGRGGMGVVYKAYDCKRERLVALKFPAPEFRHEDAMKQRLLREGRAASALDHDNICKIHEICETTGQLFIVMACYEGETLEQRLKRAPLTFPETIEIAGQIAQGLAWVHEAGLVHRDIKPANIMLNDRAAVKIVDFGVAKSAERGSCGGTAATLGTADYMSPEQIYGHEADARSDIWAFGCVMYEMVAGRAAFGGDYDQEIMYSIVNEEPRRLSIFRTGTFRMLSRVIFRCLEKNPDHRYQCADEIVADLLRTRATSTFW